jgi:uncharacterized protein (DUF2147 family)
MLAGGAVALSLALLAVPAMASPIEGTWRTQNGTEVTIAPCATGYCGTLTWVVIPKDFAAQCSQDKAAFGAQMVDTRNADAHLRTRPIVGMQMLSVKPTSDIRTFTASIYNAEDGKTYDGVIWVVNGDSVLRLGGGCLGQICVVTQDWPRVATRENTPDFTCTGN